MVYTVIRLSLTTRCLQFECDQLGPDLDGVDGLSFHAKDYQVDCNSDEHAFHIVVATAMVLLYPIGIPFTFALMTFRNKRDLSILVNEDVTEFRYGIKPWQSIDGQEKIVLTALEVQHKYEFLTGSYEPHMWYWELVEYARKFLLTGKVCPCLG